MGHEKESEFSPKASLPFSGAKIRWEAFLEHRRYS